MIKSNKALSFLNNRHVTHAEIEEFQVGYCDPYCKLDNINYVSYLPNKFSDSIIIPVLDLYNNYLGVYSRRLMPTTTSKKIDGSSWAKSDHLFGLNKAWPFIIEKNNVYIVEGPFDMIACWKHGYKNTVAILGTTLSPIQACLLSRFTSNITTILDNDTAGIEGTNKIKLLIQTYQMEHKSIQLQADPDEELNKNPNIIKEVTCNGNQ